MSFVVWMTGLSGAGKTTIARWLETHYKQQGKKVEVLDGDEIRQNLSPGLGFSEEERTAHNKRVIYLAKILSRNGVVVIVSLISPYKKVRDEARGALPNFMEVHVNCPLEVCMERDVKGLYAKAQAGEIKKMTGLSDTYEAPENPELAINTSAESVTDSARKILEKSRELGFES
mgnify:CR=1 FL=1